MSFQIHTQKKCRQSTRINHLYLSYEDKIFGNWPLSVVHPWESIITTTNDEVLSNNSLLLMSDLIWFLCYSYICNPFKKQSFKRRLIKNELLRDHTNIRLTSILFKIPPQNTSDNRNWFVISFSCVLLCIHSRLW